MSTEVEKVIEPTVDVLKKEKKDKKDKKEKKEKKTEEGEKKEKKDKKEKKEKKEKTEEGEKKEKKDKKEKKEKTEEGEKKEKKDKKEKKEKKVETTEEGDEVVEVDSPKEPKSIRQAVSVVIVDTINQKVLLIESKNQKEVLVLPRDDCKTEPTQEIPENAVTRIAKKKAGVKSNSINRVGVFSESNKKGKVTSYHWMYEINDPILIEDWSKEGRQRVWVTYEEALKATEEKKMSNLALKKCSLAKEE